MSKLSQRGLNIQSKIPEQKYDVNLEEDRLTKETD